MSEAPAAKSPAPNEKTTTEHWDGVYTTAPRLRLPSPLNVGTLNLMRLLRRYVRPGMDFLEIGCAPGKMLAWVAHELGARVSGLDYSAPGVEFTRGLFAALDIPVDLRCEDVFATTFAPGTFDVVFSAGVIEHFDDPRDIVERHYRLLKPGGTAIITVPNYGGWIGRVQARLDPENLALHNLDIMTPAALRRTAPPGAASVSAFPSGRFSPWILSLERALPGRLARLASYAANAAALLQPADAPALAPLLALEIRKG